MVTPICRPRVLLRGRPGPRWDASRVRLYHRIAGLASLPRLALLLPFSACCTVASFAQDDKSPVNDKAPVSLGATLPPYDWTGFYLGGHIGYGFGSSNVSTPGLSTSLSLDQKFDNFNESGTLIGGFQGGYNYLLPNRILIGVEADATFPVYPNLQNIALGGTRTFTSPTFGSETYRDTLNASGTVRLRLGYAPGNWLVYVTGGLAWLEDTQYLSLASTGATQAPNQFRLGYAAGAGVEFPLIPHWTARLEYLYTGYGTSTQTFGRLSLGGGTQSIRSDWNLQEVRVGLNYQFGGNPFSALFSPGQSPGEPDTKEPAAATIATPAPGALWFINPANISLHGQTTVVVQGYPAFHSPYELNGFSLPGGGQIRETFDCTLLAGLRLWPGAELWFNPEIDQGFGLEDAHGVASFPTATAYKLGNASPYLRLQRYFLRQTINLGGETADVDADYNVFAGSRTANYLVLTVGRLYPVDVFDTNKYANDPRNDFMSWGMVNNDAYDFGSDAWSTAYCAFAELYEGPWTFRFGLNTASAVPAGGADSADSYALPPDFHNFEYTGEIEYRYKICGQPGTIKIGGFDIRGDNGTFSAALAYSKRTGLDINDSLAAVRHYQNRPGGYLNWAQQVTDGVGVFARAGLSDGQVEPWDNTDCDRDVELGVSVNGKRWGRPDDTFGLAGELEGLSTNHVKFFDAGGEGIVIGDGKLPVYGMEQEIETYYKFAVTANLAISVDYEFFRNPAYNTQRGPINIFAGRIHLTF
jgi:high affinity Mn2+ porin